MTEPGGKRRQHEVAGAGAEAALNRWGQIPSEPGVGAERCGERGRPLGWHMVSTLPIRAEMTPAGM
jgi:hypothetical protein